MPGNVASEEGQPKDERRVGDAGAVVGEQADDLELIRHEQERERSREVGQDRDGHDESPLVLADPVVEEHTEEDHERGECAVGDLEERGADGGEAEALDDLQSEMRPGEVSRKVLFLLG